MFKRRKGIIIFVLSIATMALLTSIASAATCTLSGLVTDESGSPLDSALVEVFNPGTDTMVTSTSTDASGYYAVNVEEGVYDVRVLPPPTSGFEESTVQNQEVSGDSTLDFILVPVAPVTVSGRLVDKAGNPIANVGNVLLTGIGGDTANTDWNDPRKVDTELRWSVTTFVCHRRLVA